MLRDNNIVTALGFVTLYAAYVEESVDELMNILSKASNIPDKMGKATTKKKINWCINTLQSFKNENLNELIELLNDAKESLERRNEVIHGRIYAAFDRSENLKSGRDGIPDREVTAVELYDLAEYFLNLQASIPNHSCFEIMRSINDKNNS